MTGIKRGVGHGQTREGARQYLHVLYGGGDGPEGKLSRQ